jgi:hypothetical protein
MLAPPVRDRYTHLPQCAFGNYGKRRAMLDSHDRRRCLPQRLLPFWVR